MASNGNLNNFFSRVIRTEYKRPASYDEHFNSFRIVENLLDNAQSAFGHPFVLFMKAVVTVGLAVGGSRLLDYLSYWCDPSADSSWLNESAREDQAAYDYSGRDMGKKVRVQVTESIRQWLTTSVLNVDIESIPQMQKQAEKAAHLFIYEGGEDVARTILAQPVETADGDWMNRCILDNPCRIDGRPKYVFGARVKGGIPTIVRELTDEETARADSGAAERDKMVAELREAGEITEQVRLRSYWWYDEAKRIHTDMMRRSMVR